MEKFLLLIDGSSLLTTQFFGNLPREIMFAKTDEEKAKYFHKIMQTSKGVYTNAVFGFMRSLMKICRDQKPDYIAVAWDLSRNTFRRELYPDYKAQRSKTLQPLSDQFALCQKVLNRLNIRQFMDERYEADDFCGTLARRFESEVPVRVMTKDNDYLQLVTERTQLWIMHSSQQKTDELYAKFGLKKDSTVAERCFPLNPERVQKEFGIDPESVPDFKGLKGDTSDNIKGVPGVGEDTAVALIAKYKTLDALYAAMEGLDSKGLKGLAESWKEIGINRSPIKALLKEDEQELVGRRAAFLSRQLATIKCDIDLGGLVLEDLALNINQNEAAAVFNELEFESLKPDFGTVRADESSFEYTVTDDMSEVEGMLNELLKGSLDGARHESGCVGFTVIPGENGPRGIALTFAADKQPVTVFIKAQGFITSSYIADIPVRLDDGGVILAGFDIKKQLKALSCKGFLDAFDVSLAQYLLDPLSGHYEPSAVYSAVCGGCVINREDVMDKSTLEETWQLRQEELIRQAAQESRAAFECRSVLDERLRDAGMSELFYRMEMPLVYTLHGMEQAGILARPEILKEFGDELADSIAALEQEIYDYVGEQFNINSSKQLGNILFEKLRLPHGKKTKSGYSTSAEVLEWLRPEDPVIDKILSYRKLTKLKSTYTDGLSDCIDEDGRIRTTFNQMATATGRLSSQNPNLQNIPIRTELGRKLRKVFTAPEGYVIVDADYSQIELRILAALSKDEKLTAAYRNAHDIHTATASAVFNVPYDEVTPELRSRAKAVNFGIVYGISSFGLSNDLDIPFKEAEQYINDYFETYPQIRQYLDGLVDSATRLGYAETAFGRRRPIPQLSDNNYMQRQFGERAAMNSPIQGTAADIIKLAMLRVDARLRSELPEARLLLQVHDELLVEAPEGCADRVREILAQEMQQAAQFEVSLDVSIGVGRDWYDAH